MNAFECACGGEARLEAGITVGGKRWWVACGKCGLRTEFRTSRAAARAAWSELRKQKGPAKTGSGKKP